MARAIVNFVFAGSALLGQYPRIPVRFKLRAELRRARGYTDADEEEMRQLVKAGESIADFEPSESYDSHAVAYTKAAAVGLCWPAPGLDCPTLRECRHDVIDYGEGVYDALFEMCGKQRRKDWRDDLSTVGSTLIREMVEDAVGLIVDEVAAEKDFTEGSEGTSIAV